MAISTISDRTAVTYPGAVLQVVTAYLATETTTTTGAYTDTGLQATITPTSASSKILIIVRHNTFTNTGVTSNSGITMQFLRNGSTFITGLGGNEFGGNTLYGPANQRSNNMAMYTDSPASTSALTYKTQIRNPNGTGAVGWALNNSIDTMVLMEIAA